MQSQMSGGQMPCSPPLVANSQMAPGPRPGMPMGPGMGGPAPPICGQMMAPGGYGAPMPGVPGGYGNHMPAGSNPMMLGSGPAAGGSSGMAAADSQMGVSQNIGGHPSVGGPNIPSSQPPPGTGMPGPMGGPGCFMHSGPSMASQMHPNGSSMMASSVSGPMTTVGGTVSGISSSVPVGSPAAGQASISSSVGQSAISSTVSNQIPSGSLYMSSGSTMASQVPPSSSTTMQVPASGSNMPNQMGGYPGMQQPQQQMQPPGSGGIVPAVPNDVNGSQAMSSSSGNFGNGPGMGQVGPVGQMTSGPAQGSGGTVPGPGGMNMVATPMTGGPVSQMQNNMIVGGTLSSGSGAGQPATGTVPTGRPGNQFMGGPTNSGQMSSGLPSSAAATSQMVGQHAVGTAPRMPNPSNIGPSPGQIQMSGTQQPMPYGYGGSVAPGAPQHQSAAMNSMYGWNPGSSGGGMSQNMMSQGKNLRRVFL